MTQAAPHPKPSRASVAPHLGSEAFTPAFQGGVRVRVVPEFLAEHSDPDSGRWVFAYRIRISNECDRTLKLLSRRWEIIDADGDRKVVQGLGVVGEQPSLAPGESYDYSSGCELATPWGTMEGWYEMQASPKDDPPVGVEVRVSRFYLVSDATSTS